MRVHGFKRRQTCSKKYLGVEYERDPRIRSQGDRSGFGPPPILVRNRITEARHHLLLRRERKTKMMLPCSLLIDVQNTDGLMRAQAGA